MTQTRALFSMVLLLALAGCGGSGSASHDPSKHDPAQTTAMALKGLQAKAASGDAEAQNELGGDYRDGAGMPQDWAMDYFWNSLSAASSEQVSDRAMVSRNVAAEHLTPVQIEILDAKVKAWKPVPLPVLTPKPAQAK